MDRQTLNEYKFMDTPELVPKKKNPQQFKNSLNWLMNMFKRTNE